MEAGQWKKIWLFWKWFSEKAESGPEYPFNLEISERSIWLKIAFTLSSHVLSIYFKVASKFIEIKIIWLKISKSS